MYQSITLIGNLGQDPTMMYTPSGIPFTSFSLAVNETWTKEGVKQEKTTWWRVTCWRQLAEIVAKYCTKGKTVLVVGSKVESKHYVDKNGEVKDTLECTADTVKFLGGGKVEQGVPGIDELGIVDDSSIPF